MQKLLFALALSSAIALGSAVNADMQKTAPALPAPAGSKAAVQIDEGITHYNKGHWDVAKKHFQEALQADRSSAVAHYNLALALDKAGDHKKAIDHFRSAQELGQDNPEIQNSEILHAHLKHK